ncbi:MAG: efflux RND transporter permease subunit [Phycisphaerales bacterium]
MDIIRFSIDNPVKVSVGVILILLFGIIAFTTIPVQLTPNVDQPVITVQTLWPDTGPDEVDRDVIYEQTKQLKALAGLSKMTSIAEYGRGTIRLEYPIGIEKDTALREVSEKLRQVPKYPQGVKEPTIEATDESSRDYIAWVVFQCTDPDFDMRNLQDFGENRVQPELERVPGVSQVQVLGGFEREIQVRVDPVQLANRSITPDQLVSKLRQHNINVSAGDINENKNIVRVRTIGKYDNLDDIRQTVISGIGQPVVRVVDVASVVSSYKDPIGLVRSKGRIVLAINAQREVGSNVLRVMDGFTQAINRINAPGGMLDLEAKRMGLHGTLRLEQVYDQTTYINDALALVKSNLWVGGILAAVILLLFLRSVKSTLIISLAIPLSVIGTFVVMAALKRSVNVISLAGLAFATGMVVDNGIVVLENIDRHRKLGEKSVIAAYRATKEVWGAVLASTLTTLAVFIPVIFIQEEAGQLFRDISIAIVAAVGLSLIVSITTIPCAAKSLLDRDLLMGLAGHKKKSDKPHDAGSSTLPGDSSFRGRNAVQHFLDRLFRPAAWFVDAVADSVDALNNTWAPRLMIIIFLAVGSVFGSYLLMPPTTYLPEGNQNFAFGMVFSPPGYNIHQQTFIGQRIESQLRPYWEARFPSAEAANLPSVQAFDFTTFQMKTVQPPPIDEFFFVSFYNQMFFGATSKDPNRVTELADLLGASTRLPGVFGFAGKMPLIRTAASGAGSGVELDIFGDNLDQVVPVAQMLRDKYQAQYQRVQPDPSNFDLLGPEVRVTPKVDTGDTSRLGLSTATVGSAVQMFVDGAYSGDYVLNGDTVDLTVRAADIQPPTAEYFRDQPVATPSGDIVPLSQVADIHRSLAPQQIKRIEQRRAVSLNIAIPDTVPLDTAIQQIEADIAALRSQGVIPPTVQTDLAGTAAKLKEVRAEMLGEWHGWTFESFMSFLTSRAFLALLVTYLLMAALFESWFYPAVIMFSVPLATVGGFLGLRIVHTFVPTQQFDVLTMLGFVILIGVIVNNAILIVHQALNFMRGIAETQVEGVVAEKLPPHQAITESVRSRIRPIFMTTLTSVGGMLPLVLFPGAGSELYRGLGSVVLGGLVVGTIFTLLLVPLTMGIVLDIRQVVTAYVARKQGITPDADNQPA